MNNGQYCVYDLEPALQFRIEKATHESFSGAWGYIRKGLLEVKRKAPVRWIPEQVRRAVETQPGCEFFFCLDGSRIVGFYITLPQMDPWLGCALDWMVWIAYAHERGVLEATMPVLVEQAKERGYANIDFITPREGLVRKMRRYGFRPIQYAMRKEVEY